ncbi:hypothetical protein GCM10027610_043670 [Dactylosporangium cerinum]
MFDAARHDERVALGEGHGVLAVLVADRDVEPAVQDEEELVGVFVHVPDVLAQGVRDAHVVVVDPGHDPRAVHVVEGGQGLGQVHRSHGTHRARFPGRVSCTFLTLSSAGRSG